MSDDDELFDESAFAEANNSTWSLMMKALAAVREKFPDATDEQINQAFHNVANDESWLRYMVASKMGAPIAPADASEIRIVPDDISELEPGD